MHCLLPTSGQSIIKGFIHDIMSCMFHMKTGTSINPSFLSLTHTESLVRTYPCLWLRPVTVCVEQSDGAGGGGAGITCHSPHRTFTRDTFTCESGVRAIYQSNEFNMFNYVAAFRAIKEAVL